MKKSNSRNMNVDDDEYEIQDVSDSLNGSLRRRLASYVKQFPLKSSVLKLSSHLSSSDLIPRGNYYITTRDQSYHAWWLFMVIAALYSSMFTPVEFGFFRGLPRDLWIIDLSVQVLFLLDIVVRFFTAYTDPKTYRLVVDHRSIAMRYIKSDFILDLLGILPWDTIYKAFGHKEEVRYLVWVRLYRVRKVDSFFDRVEKNIRINYFAARIMKLLAVEFYCTHTAACIYYYLATTVSAADEGYTWIGSLALGTFSYHDFRAIDIGKRYVTSLYWAILTMATVGYGDIHAVNVREMIFVMIYVSFDMILGAYLIGNMTGLIVKGSNTERFRDKMTTLIKYMNRNGLPRNIRSQMKNHVRLQFENGTMKEGENLLEDFPVSIRAKVAQTLYSQIVEQVSIFKGCSPEFLNEIVSRLTEEFFLPGEVVISQGGTSDQFYIVCHGTLEEILVHEDGKEEKVDLLQEENVFGEVGVLCNIPQPFTVRVLELCRVLRLEKHEFSDIVEIYFNDGRMVIDNLLECKDTDARVGQIAADVTFLVAKHAAELALMVNNASYQGDLVHLKHLVKEGAVVVRPDYDGRTALHLAASKGFEAVVLYLIREGADVNAIDKFGVSPLLESVKGGHDKCLSVLMDKGAELHLQDEGAFLCKAVKTGNNELLRRLLVAGVNVNASDYDNRTALHLAAAEGSFGLAKMLMEAGADIFAQDRWGRTPLDEAMLHKHSNVTAVLKDASQKSQSTSSVEFRDMTLAHRAQKLFPRRGSADFSSPRIDDEEKSPSAHSHREIHHMSSPQSSDSYTVPPTRGRQAGGMDRQSSSGRRLDLGLGPDPPIRKSIIDGGDSPHRYRILPLRKGRRGVRDDQPAVSAAKKSRRITIYPYHPWTPARMWTPGKVEWVPPSIEDVLNLAYKHFAKSGTKVFNQDAGEISSTEYMMDSEKVYVVDEEDIVRGRSIQ